ncbi:MAG: hypothetical protein CR217_06805 [Beijerinckiaceae bacterium]|nr:MAG: hypothetical protein CR217_06805 [Beijerinckiaceae bacterium]
METCAARRLERSTIDSYRQDIKFHIRPFIGNIKLSRVTAPRGRLRWCESLPGALELSWPMRKSAVLWRAKLSVS